MDLLDGLRWRYATKRFDPERRVSDEQVRQLAEAVNLTASSFGLQHYRLIVVQDQATQEELRKVSYDQPQVTECSHVFVLAAKTDLSGDYVDDYMRRMAETRGVELDQVSGFGEYIKGSLSQRDANFIANWNKRQAYMGLSTLLAACGELRIDSCPMEGFQPEDYDRILGLSARGLTATVIAAVGYRAEGDATQHHKKVRLPLEEFVTVIS